MLAGEINVKNVWWVLSAVLLPLFIIIPIISIFLNLEIGTVISKINQPIVYEALRVSFSTSLISILLVVILGTPLAYVLASKDFKGKRLLDSLVDLPMVLPPAVAGVALLMAFGRRGLIGQSFGLNVSFTFAAVVLAQIFVAAPFFVRAAKSSFQAVPKELKSASLTLGVTPWRTFWRVTLPLSAPGLMGGLVMSWARALGEFGATIMFAGNFRGVTQTLPLAIYTAMESDFQAAMVISALMVIISLAVLILVRHLTNQ